MLKIFTYVSFAQWFFSPLLKMKWLDSFEGPTDSHSYGTTHYPVSSYTEAYVKNHQQKQFPQMTKSIFFFSHLDSNCN